VRVVVGVVSVHSELLILHLLEAMEFGEKLEFLHKASERLRVDIIEGTKID
jgi:hypothetical protein